jgi:PrsW family intramembrane metalloprotease
VIAPLPVYSAQSWTLTDFAWRNRLLAASAGAVVVALVWLTGTALLRVMPMSPLQSPLAAALIYGAGLEEIFKLLALLLLWRAVRLRPSRDLLPAATGIACGFAAAENVLALWWATYPVMSLFQRIAMALPMHLAFAAIVASILARHGLRAATRVIAALLAVIALHTGYDAASFAGLQTMPLVILVVLGVFACRAWRLHLRHPAGA